MGESPHVTPNKMVASYYIPQEKCLRGVGLAHGMWLDNPAMVERAVNNVIEKRPAAALLLGDLVYHTVSPEGSEIDQLSRKKFCPL